MLINNCGYCVHNDYYLTDSGIPLTLFGLTASLLMNHINNNYNVII